MHSNEMHRAQRHRIVHAHRQLIIAALVMTGIGLNIVLQIFVSPMLWPYFWPRPAVFILLGGVVAAFWVPELLRGIWPLRMIGALMVFIGQSYWVHSVMVLQEHVSIVSLVHFLGFSGSFVVMTLNYINQITPANSRLSPPLPAQLPAIAVVIPTYGEPVDILEQTVVALKALTYPSDRLFILISDDGHREEVRQLAERHGIQYNLGARKDAKAGNLNAALAHIALFFPHAELILTQDADELIHPGFLQKTVGYFRDPKLALVQTPKEAFTPSGDPFGNRDRIFYDILQPGRNGSGAAFSCGSGVLWRISALQAIGGFSTWNIVEDMTTSYILHSAGFRSAYHNEILTIGLSPDDLPGLLKQRGTWAADTWRFFLFNNPLWRPGLTIRQRLQYTELGLFYLSSMIFIPLLMFTPLLSLLTGDFIPIEGSALFPWMMVSILYYVVLAQGNLTYLVRMWQYWIGHWPTYTKAFIIAVRSRYTKPSYKVTRKTRQHGFYGQLIWPQFTYIGLSLILIVRGLFWMPDISLGTRLVNIGILVFFIAMVSGICRAAFYGMTMAVWRNLATNLLRTVFWPVLQSASVLRQMTQGSVSLWRNRSLLEAPSEQAPAYTLLSQASLESSAGDGEYRGEEHLLEREVGA